MLEKLFKLFDKCEDIRYKENIKNDPGYAFIGKSGNYYKARHEEFLKKLEKHKFGKTTKTGENLDAIKLYDLSNEEASIIYMYTHHSVYAKVNSQLRNSFEYLEEDVREYSTLLDKALKKLPSFNDEEIYRDVKNPYPDLETSIKYFQSNYKQYLLLYINFSNY